MSSKYTHKKIRQSIQGNLRRYEAIALSMAIGFELEEFIEERGISKQELAEAAGISPSYLSQVFSGDRLINISMLAGISQKYKVRFSFDIQDAKAEKIREFAFDSWTKPYERKAMIFDRQSFSKKHDYGYPPRVMGSDCGNQA